MILIQLFALTIDKIWIDRTRKDNLNSWKYRECLFAIANIYLHAAVSGSRQQVKQFAIWSYSAHADADSKNTIYFTFYFPHKNSKQNGTFNTLDITSKTLATDVINLAISKHIQITLY